MSRHTVASVPIISVLLIPSELGEGRYLQVPRFELEDAAYFQLGEI